MKPTTRLGYYKPSDAATATGLTLGWIYQLLRTAQIPGAKREDGKWQVPAGWVNTRKLAK